MFGSVHWYTFLLHHDAAFDEVTDAFVHRIWHKSKHGKAKMPLWMNERVGISPSDDTAEIWMK